MPGLEDLYREIILDHYRSPRNRGELPVPPAHRVDGYNPLCGDEVVVYIQLDGDTISDIRIGGQGCSISQSSASLMSQAVKGRSISEARGLVRTFRQMMSLHEARIADSGAPGGAGAGEPNGGGAGAGEPNGGGAGAGEPNGGGGSDDDQDYGGEVDLDALGELAALQGVVKFPVRIKCATLSWNALTQALDEMLSS